MSKETLMLLTWLIDIATGSDRVVCNPLMLMSHVYQTILVLDRSY